MMESIGPIALGFLIVLVLVVCACLIYTGEGGMLVSIIALLVIVGFFVVTGRSKNEEPPAENTQSVTVVDRVYNFLDCTAAPEHVKPNALYSRVVGHPENLWIAIDGSGAELNPDYLGENSRAYCRWLERLP